MGLVYHEGAAHALLYFFYKTWYKNTVSQEDCVLFYIAVFATIFWAAIFLLWLTAYFFAKPMIGEVLIATILQYPGRPMWDSARPVDNGFTANIPGNPFDYLYEFTRDDEAEITRISVTFNKYYCRRYRNVLVATYRNERLEDCKRFGKPAETLTGSELLDLETLREIIRETVTRSSRFATKIIAAPRVHPR